MCLDMNTKIRVSAIAAMDSKTRTIGQESGGMPWERIPEDMRHFKNKTMGHPMIMGRVTWEEFLGRPLKGRTHIIVTKDRYYDHKIRKLRDDDGYDLIIVFDVKEAIEIAKEIEEVSDNKQKEVFVIGGAQIYQQALPFCDRLYLTHVNAKVNTSIKFPDYKFKGWDQLMESRTSSDTGYGLRFETLEKEEVSV